MINIFKNTSKKDRAAKEMVIKQVFNTKTQKKVVTRAANQSAEDQKLLITKYNNLVKI